MRPFVAALDENMRSFLSLVDARRQVLVCCRLKIVGDQEVLLSLSSSVSRSALNIFLEKRTRRRRKIRTSRYLLVLLLVFLSILLLKKRGNCMTSSPRFFSSLSFVSPSSSFHSREPGRLTLMCPPLSSRGMPLQPSCRQVSFTVCTYAQAGGMSVCLSVCRAVLVSVRCGAVCSVSRCLFSVSLCLSICSGLVDLLHIMAVGYSCRVSYDQLWKRYEAYLPCALRETVRPAESKEATQPSRIFTRLSLSLSMLSLFT